MDLTADFTRSDAYLLYCYKILSCPLKSSHDWSRCSWAHPKEQARRRDPRRCFYLPVMCPHAKQGAFCCPRGDHCGLSHHVYEAWLHPLKLRTEMCRKGARCDRPICFFGERKSARSRKQPSPWSGLAKCSLRCTAQAVGHDRRLP